MAEEKGNLRAVLATESLADEVDRMQVTGELTVTFDSPELYRAMSLEHRDWNREGAMQNLGTVLAYNLNGQHYCCAWACNTLQVWAKFAAYPPIGLMRGYMLDAVPIDQPQPEGYIRTRCADLTAPKIHLAPWSTVNQKP